MSGMLNADPAQLGEGVPEEVRQALAPWRRRGGLAGLGAMMRQLGGAMIGGQTGTAVGEWPRGGRLGRHRAAARPGGHGRAAARGRSRVRPGAVGGRRGGPALPGPARGRHQRLFAHVPWLREHLLGAVEQYASGITVDMARLQEAMPRSTSPTPRRCARPCPARACSGRRTPGPEGRAVPAGDGPGAGRGVGRDGGQRGRAERLTHAARWPRRSGGAGPPAARRRTFATLVGLELRPRRLREAATLWQGLTEARGIDGRDALWAHPDLLPAADDLENPDASCTASPRSTSRTWTRARAGSSSKGD